LKFGAKPKLGMFWGR